MEYGTTLLSIVPGRAEPSDAAEQTTQLLFSETFQVLDKRAKWTQVKLLHDQYECWICNKQWAPILKKEVERLNKKKLQSHNTDLFSVCKKKSDDSYIPLPLGARLPDLQGDSFTVADEEFVFQGQLEAMPAKLQKDKVVEHAFMFLNAPYLWGGKTPFGIDCSGLVQNVYRMAGMQLPRDAFQQAECGTVLSFIEEAQPGDLAFFDNKEGRITHVGILLGDNLIIHASGHVRIDKLDHQGIFVTETKEYTHRLRLLKTY